MNENKVLIAVDLSENSLAAVDYVGTMLANQESARITLLHVIREPSPDVMPDAEERKNHVEERRNAALSALEQVGVKLRDQGIPEKNLTIKIQVCGNPISIADLVLHERTAGEYGTVVVGRRGVSKREEFLFGSVSSRVVREAKNCAVWVVS